MQSYTIKIQQFEGPFDLLLFFIERDELDINDIPIATITDDFLAYIKALEKMNIDVASEFILVAATLMRIKARLLIPRKELNELGNEIDPREELTQRLLEYKKYKDILDQMRQMEQDQSLKFDRGNVSSELRKIASKALVDVELESLTLYKLLNTFKRMMEDQEARSSRTIHRIVKYNYTISEQQAYIFDKLKKVNKLNFVNLFIKLENRIHAIITFLSLLELLNQQTVVVTQGEGVNNFWISLA
ncbi:MAG: segregation/condensation protein A [Saprospiraceae bacterium]